MSNFFSENVKWAITLVVGLVAAASSVAAVYFEFFHSKPNDTEILWAKYYSHQDLTKEDVCPSNDLYGYKFYFENTGSSPNKVSITTTLQISKLETNPVVAYTINQIRSV